MATVYLLARARDIDHNHRWRRASHGPVENHPPTRARSCPEQLSKSHFHAKKRRILCEKRKNKKFHTYRASSGSAVVWIYIYESADDAWRGHMTIESRGESRGRRGKARNECIRETPETHSIDPEGTRVTRLTWISRGEPPPPPLLLCPERRLLPRSL